MGNLETNKSEGIRLNKYIALCGICARRKADEIIKEGRVKVNGNIITNPGFICNPADIITLDDEKITPKKKRLYFVLNKPKGILCTHKDSKGRPTVFDIIPCKERLFCVGRLDKDSEGLVILTNDGNFAYNITHPSKGVLRRYRVKIKGKLDGEKIKKLAKGVWLAEGKTRGAKVYVKKRTRDFTVVDVVICEGKNREVRRIFAKVGHPVIRLKRLSIGNLSLQNLKEGQYRRLSYQEIKKIFPEVFQNGI